MSTIYALDPGKKSRNQGKIKQISFVLPVQEHISRSLSSTDRFGCVTVQFLDCLFRQKADFSIKDRKTSLTSGRITHYRCFTDVSKLSTQA